MSSLLIIGCGSVGRHLARHYLDQGDRVIGVVRSQESAAALEAEGIEALVLDLSRELHPEEPDRLPMAARDGGHVGNAGAFPDLAGARVFHLAPPPENGIIDLHTRHLIAGFAQAGHPFRIVYVSTTGVYGNCGGDWVDEDRPVHPQEDRARRRWDAEQALERWRQDSGGALVTLRVAGIYGPGRLPLERIRAGLPLVRPEDAPWSNRIHVDDLVTACIAAMGRGADGAVYNVCDGHPSTMTDYFFQIADAVGLPRPPTIPMNEAEGRLSAGMLSYMRESRRLSNRRLVEDLGVRLRYPTLAQGLPTCR
jgi:nucleoside-diphosphate-sugar epimerase